MATTKKLVSLKGKKLTYKITYEVHMDDLELESFIQDEMDHLNGMGSATIDDVVVEDQ